MRLRFSLAETSECARSRTSLREEVINAAGATPLTRFTRETCCRPRYTRATRYTSRIVSRSRALRIRDYNRKMIYYRRDLSDAIYQVRIRRSSPFDLPRYFHRVSNVSPFHVNRSDISRLLKSMRIFVEKYFHSKIEYSPGKEHFIKYLTVRFYQVYERRPLESARASVCMCKAVLYLILF